MADHATTPHSPRAGNGREDGQAMVELAMVLPILFMVLFGVMQLGQAFWSYQQLSAAVSEGARTAALSRSTGNQTSLVTSAVRAAAPNLDASDISVSVSSSWTTGDPVTVTATYPISVDLLGQVVVDRRITSTRTARVEQ